ncbi:hypothetical protein PIB30_060428 [Stylosanthes scabra]|uniref:Uncharacterized protein n=1 Tax=Stylosanthes scabra TaxID=79078 RepID=A0ABU6TMP4_9FABA|nr:hypothetical protein [Stylosanthes scabra]
MRPNRGLVACLRRPLHAAVGVVEVGEHVGKGSVAAVDPTPGASTQGYVDDTPREFGSLRQSFFEGILCPASMEQQFGQRPPTMLIWPGVYRSPPRAPVPVDLNVPAHDFTFEDFSFAVGGTPPSAFVDPPPITLTWTIRRDKMSSQRSLRKVVESCVTEDVILVAYVAL